MNTNPAPPPIDLAPLPANLALTGLLPVSPPSVKLQPAPGSKRRYVPGLANWFVGIVVLLILIGVALPTVTGRVGTRVRQVKSMLQAKQIGRALKLFANDHEGEYPRTSLPGMPTAWLHNSNEGFAMLFPAYVQDESIFGNPLSAYQTRPPDNVIDPAYTGHPVRTLEPGENVYAYVAGLVETANPATPLVADGTDGTGHYTTDPKQRGGVWEGQKALVVHLDNSAALETLAGPEHSRFIPRHAGKSEMDAGNQLDVSDFGFGVRLLDPAVRR